MGRELDFLTAARVGDSETVCKFLKLATKPTSRLASFRRSLNINFQDYNKYTALHYACLNGHKKIVHQLLFFGACVDELDKGGSTPLFLASWAGHDDIVKMLLCNDSPANPNLQTCKNETPLHSAAQHGYDKVVNLLLIYGADPYVRNDAFQTALDLAAQFGHLQVVQALLSNEPNLIKLYRRSSASEVSDLLGSVNPCQQFFTQTCLHLASCNGHNRVVETLLEAGVYVNILTSAGSALHEASLHGKKSVVITLLRAGIDVSAKNKHGRTALEELANFPPPVTHDIVTIINEFILSKRNLIKSNEAPSCSRSLVDNSQQSLERRLHEQRLGQNRYYKHKEQPKQRKKQDNFEISKSLSSLEAKPPANYLEMKPVKPVSTNDVNSMGSYPDVYRAYEPVYKQAGVFFSNDSSPSPSYENLKPHSSSEDHSFSAIASPYEVMKLSPSTASPRPIGDYELVLVNNNEPTNLPTSGLDSNNNNCNKKWSRHSPTPDHPPPTGIEAEATISDYMHQVSVRQDSLAGSSTSKTNSICSDVVEQFVGDIPFAGLFKGSTLNLSQDMDGRDESLRSPSMVSTVTKLNQRRSPTKLESATGNGSRLWDEIETIFEQINDEMFSVEQETHVNGVSKQQKQVPSKEEQQPSQVNNNRQSLHIRNPADLLLGRSQNIASHWCHSPYTLAYGKICYTVFYLGSTVIRHLQGTISARKSIQKLKIDESLQPAASVSDLNLLANCNTSTKYLKAVNLQTRLKVDIAASCQGVQFIDHASKTAICSHDIENINCVCQDAEDLRYFAYLTKEQDMHYCHVFMVDCVELANEIILTLGQAFEVAYQLAISRQNTTLLPELEEEC